jgi:hypothetical protein
MSLSQQDQQRIIDQESAWIDQQFSGGLDLSQFPSLAPPPPPDSHDDRFARTWEDSGLSRDATALRQFVSNPDTDALDRAGRETGDLNFRAEVRDRQGELIAEAFKRANPGYIPTEANYRAITATLIHNALGPSHQDLELGDQVSALIEGGFWTVDNLTACYHALTQEGLLEVELGEPRNLNEREKLRVARLAQAGRADEAIGEFLRCAMDGVEPSMELVNDPSYRNLCNDAVLTVFENAQLDYVATPARQKFLLRYAGSRPLTLALLQRAWLGCQENEKRHSRGELLGQFQHPRETEPPTAKQLDAMDDDAVNDLYHRSLRHYADSVRHSAGIIA